jgi:hypothetical protein
MPIREIILVIFEAKTFGIENLFRGKTMMNKKRNKEKGELNGISG